MCGHKQVVGENRQECTTNKNTVKITISKAPDLSMDNASRYVWPNVRVGIEENEGQV